MKKFLLLVFIFSAQLLFSQNIAVNTSGTAAAAANMFEVTQPASAPTDYVSIFAKNLSTGTNAYAIWAEATAGTNKYAIVVPYNKGSVGIGTITPSRLLHIRSTPTVAEFFGIRISTDHDPSDPVIELYHETANKGFRWRLGAAAASTLFLDYSTNAFGSWTPYMVVLNTGEVGIGTTSPGSLLDLDGSNATITMGLNSVAGRASVQQTVGTDLHLNANAKYAGSWNRFDVGLSAWNVSLGALNDLFEIRRVAAGANPITWQTFMHISNSGNVGIGTTIPVEKLHVSGGNILLVGTDTWGVSMMVNNASGSNTWRWVTGGTVGDINVPIGGMAIHHDGNNSPIQIKNDGTVFMNVANVGIGTTGPVELLHLSAVSNTTIRLSHTDATSAVNSISYYEGGTLYGFLNQRGSSHAEAGQFNMGNNTGATAICSGPGGVDRIHVNANGNVGIGTTTPGYKLQVGNVADGTEARANAWNTLSDKRLKKDFEILPNALEKVMQLNGYYYYWNTGTDKRKQFGVISQEVQSVLPEITSTDAEGYISVDYSKLTPLLINAIKEQQKIIDSQKKEIESLNNKFTGLEAIVKTLQLQISTSAEKK